MTSPRLAACLRHFERLLWRGFSLACRRPRTTLALFTLALGVCLAALPRLSTVVSVSDLLTEGDPSLARYRSLQRDFDLGQTAIVVFSRVDGARLDPADLCRVRDAVRGPLAGSPDVARAESPFEARQTVSLQNRLLYMPLLNLACSPWEHLSPLERSLVTADASALGGPLGPVSRSVFGPALVDGNGTRVLAHVDLVDAKDRVKMGSFDPGQVRTLQSRLDAAFALGGESRPGPALVAEVTGLARHKEQLLKGIEDDRYLNLAAVGLILFLCRLLFGRLRGGFVLVTTLVAAGIYTYGSMALMGGRIDMLSNGLFILLTVATMQDFIFLVGAMAKRPAGAWHGPFRRLIVPSFFTSFTTVIGFGSLVFSDLAIIRSFGVYAALGVMFEWAIVFFAVPALLTLAPWLRIWSAPRLPSAHRLPGALARLVRYVPSRTAVALALCLLPLSFIALTRLRTGDSPLLTFPASHPHRVTMAALRSAFGFETEISLVIQSGDAEQGRPAAQRAMAALRARPEVGHVISPWDVRESFTRNLPQGHADLVLREIAQQSEYRRYFNPQRGEARALVLLTDSGSDAVDALNAIVARECPAGECALAGEAVAFADFTRKVTSTLIESLFVSLVLATGVLLLLAAALGQARAGSMLTASLWGPLVTVGLLPLLPIQVNFVTSVFASVVVGLAGDNAIQFWFASRRKGLRAGLDARGEGALQLGACMILASLLLCFSTFTPPRVLGGLLALSFLLMTAGDLFLARGLLAWKGNFTTRGGAGKLQDPA